MATPADPKLKPEGKAKAHSPRPETNTLPSTPSTFSVADYIMGTDYQTWQSFAKNGSGIQEANPPTSSAPHSPCGASSSSEGTILSSASYTSTSSNSGSTCSEICCSDKHRGESLLCKLKKRTQTVIAAHSQVQSMPSSTSLTTRRRVLLLSPIPSFTSEPTPRPPIFLISYHFLSVHVLTLIFYPLCSVFIQPCLFISVQPFPIIMLLYHVLTQPHVPLITPPPNSDICSRSASLSPTTFCI